MSQQSGLKEVKEHKPSQFTIDFCDFYLGILLKLYNVKDRSFLIAVRYALKNMRQLNYNVRDSKQKTVFGIFSYNEPPARCAYMYAYSIINTSVVYCEFLKHLKNIECQSLEFFSRNSFRICCLGGGPGIEIIGLCRAINDAVWKSNENGGNSAIEIHVTIVDICPEWKSEASLMFKAASDSTTLFSPRRISFQVEYLQADLLEPLDDAVKKAIQESDIVTIVKVLNEVQNSSPVDCSSKLYKMVANVSRNMTGKSCVFMLDTSGGTTIKLAMGTLPTFKKSCRILKLTNEHKAYRLHPTVLQKLEQALDFKNLAHIKTLLPTPLTRISSCIWLKIKAPAVEEKNKIKENKKKLVPSEN